MKRIISLLAAVGFSVASVKAVAYEDIEIHGETEFSCQASISLKTSIYTLTSVTIFEPAHARWEIALTSVINPEFDHFQNELRVNVFTVLGVHF